MRFYRIEFTTGIFLQKAFLLFSKIYCLKNTAQKKLPQIIIRLFRLPIYPFHQLHHPDIQGHQERCVAVQRHGPGGGFEKGEFLR